MPRFVTGVSRAWREDAVERWPARSSLALAWWPRYDAFDGPRDDLPAYVGVAGELGAGRVLVMGAASPAGLTRRTGAGRPHREPTHHGPAYLPADRGMAESMRWRADARASLTVVTVPAFCNPVTGMFW